MLMRHDLAQYFLGGLHAESINAKILIIYLERDYFGIAHQN